MSTLTPEEREMLLEMPAARALIAEAVAAERQACLAEAKMRVTEMVEVPCPDGLPGCAVLHQKPLERHRNWREIADAISARGTS